MTERRELLMNVLSNLIAFIVFFNIFAFIFTFAIGYMPWPYLFSIVPFFFLFFLRRKVEKMWLFLLVHLALLVPPFLVLHDATLFGITMASSALVIVYSIYRKGKDEWAMQGTSAIWVIVVLAATSILFATYMPYTEGISIFLNLSSLTALASIVLFVHIDNMRFSLGLMGEHQRKSAEVSPVSNILISIFLAVIVILGALSILFPSQTTFVFLLRLAGDIVLFPFRLLSAFISWLIGDSDVVEIPTLNLPVFEQGEMMLEDGIPMDDAQQTWFMTLTNILSIVIVVAIVIGIVGTLFYKLYKAFGKGKTMDEEQSVMTTDAISKLKFALGDIKELLPRFKLGSKHPVRKAYIKKINGHIKQGVMVQSHHTPDIIADKIRPKEDIDELTQRYEEVRYGRL